MKKFKKHFPQVGFYAIGIMNSNSKFNVGTLWRSAYILGASYIFTVNKKYKFQSSDVTHSFLRIPYFHYDDINDLKNHLPHSAPLIGVELIEEATLLQDFQHPPSAVYLLGSEANGLSQATLDKCHKIIKLSGNFSLNVAVAGSILMYDRIAKTPTSLPKMQKNNN